MSARSWWVGVVILAAALCVHALVPRYDIRIDGVAFVRIDRWTGRVELGQAKNLSWVSTAISPATLSDIDHVLATPPATH